MKSFLLAGAFAAALALGGCRSVAVENEPGLAYTVEVQNATNTNLVVSYRDDRGVHELGAVAAGARERFVVAGAASTSVTIYGVSSNATRTTRSQQVTLVSGVTVPVRLTF